MRTIALKRIIGSLCCLCPMRTPRTVVLIYHSIGDGPFAVSERDFTAQIQWLAANGLFILPEEIARGSHSEPLRVCVTFDDGYASVRDAALPVLQQHNATATVYLNSGMIGDAGRHDSDPSLGHYPDEKFMTWRDVKELVNAKWTVGSHGVAHIDLTRLSPAVVKEQLVESKSAIESRLEIPCRHFAYTWGRHSANVRTAVSDAGYVTAVAGLHGPVVAGSDGFALPRIDVRAEYKLRDFVNVVTGRWDFLTYLQKRRCR